MIRAIVIDDEKPSREVICNLLHDYCKDVQVIKTADSVKAGYKAIMKDNPDLVFLDIELEDGTSFDLLKMFDRINFKIIFITAFSEHAIKAFRVNAIDYLLKPINIDELVEAIEKIKNYNGDKIDSSRIVELIKSMPSNLSSEIKLVIPHIKGFEVLKVNEIVMCKADGYCTEFYLTGNKKVISSKNLKHYETDLPESYFFRTHNSYLVNLNHVCSFTKQGIIGMTEGIKAILADSRRNKFKQILKKYQNI